MIFGAGGSSESSHQDVCCTGDVDQNEGVIKNLGRLGTAHAGCSDLVKKAEGKM